MSKVVTPHEEFYHAVLITGMLFRAFVIVIIGAFLVQRDTQQIVGIIGITSLAALFIFGDMYLTVRTLFGYTKEYTAQLVAALIKILIIVMLLMYAFRIWVLLSFWAYSAFAIFVAALYGLDFILLKKLEHVNSSKT